MTEHWHTELSANYADGGYGPRLPDSAYFFPPDGGDGIDAVAMCERMDALESRLAAAEAELDAIRKEFPAGKSILEGLHEERLGWFPLQDRAIAAEAALSEARAWLEAHRSSSHEPTCQRYEKGLVFSTEADCTCGLDALIAALARPATETCSHETKWALYKLTGRLDPPVVYECDACGALLPYDGVMTAIETETAQT